MVSQSKLIASTFARKLVLRSEECDNANLVDRLVDGSLECMIEDDNLRMERIRINPNDHEGLRQQKEALYDTCANAMFLKIERRSQLNNNNSVCSDKLVRSTAKPMVLANVENTSKLDKVILKIAEMKQDRTTIANYFIDDYNNDLFSVPLNDVVTSSSNNNRSVIIHASTQELPKNLQKNNQKYVYEFAWVSNLSDVRNQQVSGIIYEFLNITFRSESSHIRLLLKNPTTVVLMILNRESETTEKLSVENIVSMIMFGNEDLIGTCIDFIATALHFTGMSFGTFLLHTAQVFGSKAIERKSSGSIKANYTTVLSCVPEMEFYYKRQGFSKCKFEEFNPEGEFKGAGRRMEIIKWKNDKKDKLVIMRTNTLCERSVNYLSYFPVQLEDELYGAEDAFKEWDNVTCSEDLSTQFGVEVGTLLRQRQCFKLNDKLKDMCRTSRTKKIFFEKLYKQAMEIPVGRLYRNATNVVNMASKDEGNASKTSLLFEEALSALKLVMYFKEIHSDTEFDKQECWMMVSCGYCKKHVFVKKHDDDYMNDFLMHVILSVWFVHIFGLENVTNNKWYDINKNWNVCCGRKGSIYNKLKSSYHLDSIKLSEDDHVGYYRSLMNLEGLWENLDQYLTHYYDNCCRIAFIVDEHMKTDLDRRNVGKTYAERSRELLQCIAPSKRYTDKDVDATEYKRHQNQLNRQKKKREREIKEDRHEAEHEWKKIFYKDLDLQLRLRFIEHVHVHMAGSLNPVSEEYVEEQTALRRSRKKTNAALVDDFHHFLMYETLTSTPHVVDEDWFQDINEETGVVTRKISAETIDRCQEKPNELWRLTKTELRQIKLHVNNVKVGCQISRIKRVAEKRKDQDEEFVSFDGHVSSSKYSFLGYDIKRNYYNVSEDWIELNFKRLHPQVFKDIMKLKPGEMYDIPAGSSNRLKVDQNIEHWNKININPSGPPIKFVQENKPSCLPCSIASALEYMQEGIIAKRIIAYYETFENDDSKKAFTMNDVLAVTMYNKGRAKNEKRLKCVITKVKQPNVSQILNDRTDNSFYHCVLINQHAIVCCDGWIFDSTLSNAMPRDETHLRYSAESYTHEDTKHIIILCYKYTW